MSVWWRNTSLSVSSQWIKSYPLWTLYHTTQPVTPHAIIFLGAFVINIFNFFLGLKKTVFAVAIEQCFIAFSSSLCGEIF